MDFDDIDDETDGSTIAVPIKDPSGRDRLALILKYTFHVDERGRVEIVHDAPPPRLVDDHGSGDPAVTSIRKPSMLFDDKPGTDVVLAGHAHPPSGRAAEHVDVSLRVGPIRKTVRAWGLRVWQAGTFGALAPGPARPIKEPVPLRYELAWGGYDDSDPAEIVADERNYLGRGVARSPKSLVGQPAAQLEDPANPIGARANVPMSFGPIHRHWQPRAAFAGTYDEAWMLSKMPLLPDDFDPRFHIAVPHDQWSPVPLRGDEPIEVLGATPEGAWRFQLPRIAPGFVSWVGGARRDHRTHLDTIVVDADERIVELFWRASFVLPRKYQMLDHAAVFMKRVR